jgi:hypothetical protein
MRKVRFITIALVALLSGEAVAEVAPPLVCHHDTPSAMTE